MNHNWLIQDSITQLWLESRKQKKGLLFYWTKIFMISWKKRTTRVRRSIPILVTIWSECMIWWRSRSKRSERKRSSNRRWDRLGWLSKVRRHRIDCIRLSSSKTSPRSNSRQINSRNMKTEWKLLSLIEEKISTIHCRFIRNKPDRMKSKPSSRGRIIRC